MENRDLLLLETPSNSVSKRGETASVYARFFDERCSPWINDSEVNLMFLKRQETYANDLLRTRGYLFLNEVYTLLGMPWTQAGRVVGWVYDKDNPVGDNMVDFALFAERNRDFVNGYVKSALLDFNVDGFILDKVILK